MGKKRMNLVEGFFGKQSNKAKSPMMHGNAIKDGILKEIADKVFGHFCKQYKYEWTVSDGTVYLNNDTPSSNGVKISLCKIHEFALACRDEFGDYQVWLKPEQDYSWGVIEYWSYDYLDSDADITNVVMDLSKTYISLQGASKAAQNFVNWALMNGATKFFLLGVTSGLDFTGTPEKIDIHTITPEPKHNLICNVKFGHVGTFEICNGTNACWRIEDVAAETCDLIMINSNLHKDKAMGFEWVNGMNARTLYAEISYDYHRFSDQLKIVDLEKLNVPAQFGIKLSMYAEMCVTQPKPQEVFEATGLSSVIKAKNFESCQGCGHDWQKEIILIDGEPIISMDYNVYGHEKDSWHLKLGSPAACYKFASLRNA